MRNRSLGNPPRNSYKVQILITCDVLAYSDQEAEEEALFQLERNIKRGVSVDAEFDILDVDIGEHDLSDEHEKETA